MRHGTIQFACGNLTLDIISLETRQGALRLRASGAMRSLPLHGEQVYTIYAEDGSLIAVGRANLADLLAAQAPKRGDHIVMEIALKMELTGVLS